MTKHKVDSGYTLVEVAIVVPTMIIIGGLLFTVLFNMANNNSIAQARVIYTHTAQQAMSAIESEVQIAKTFLTTDNTGLTDPYAPSGGWSYKGTSATDRVLILENYSTTTNPLLGGSTGRRPVYIGNPAGAECSGTSLYYNNTETYNTIYFVESSTLKRRRIVDNTTSHCNPQQYQKFSCPINSSNALCQANDEVIANNVQSFSIDYYPTEESSVVSDAYASGASTSLITDAVAVKVSITIGSTISKKAVSHTSSLRIKRFN